MSGTGCDVGAELNEWICPITQGYVFQKLHPKKKVVGMIDIDNIEENFCPKFDYELCK